MDIGERWKLSRRERQAHRAYRRKIVEARASADKGAEEHWDDEWGTEAFEIEEERRRLNQRSVRRRAERWYIPLPPYTDAQYWEEAHTTPGGHFLTTYGMNDLLGKIRAERKGRLEVWTPVIAALTGVLGALTGLLAILLKR
jgi:hypothetical protein